MAAQTLRNIFSGAFNVPARKIHLASEPISPEWVGELSEGMSYSDASYEGDLAIWSFNPKDGIKEVFGCIASTWYYNGNHDQDYTPGSPLHECVNGGEMFFIIKSGSDASDGGEYYTLYKSPDFAEHWAKLEAEDVERWAQWLS